MFQSVQKLAYCARVLGGGQRLHRFPANVAIADESDERLQGTFFGATMLLLDRRYTDRRIEIVEARQYIVERDFNRFVYGGSVAYRG